MRVGRHRLRWLFALAMIGLLITAAWRTFHGPATNTSVRLADGRQVMFKGLTYGKKHRFVSGSPLAKTLVYAGATNWAARFGARVFSDPAVRALSIATNSDLLMLWLEVRGTNVGTNPSVLQPIVATVMDVDGHESGRNSLTALANSPGMALYGFPISSFPRRDKTFLVRFWEIVKGDFIPLAEFKVRNPARGSFPAWMPETLPIERRTGDEVFALVGFNTGLSATGLVKQQKGSMWTELLFRIGTNEPVANRFQLHDEAQRWRGHCARLPLDQ